VQACQWEIAEKTKNFEKSPAPVSEKTDAGL
jgi:hypothetical protein